MNEELLCLSDYRDTEIFTRLMRTGGASNFPPAIISCAITGGNAGKEVNPNLPESLEEQVEQTYEAYSAGASIVHIHRRDPLNPAVNSTKAEEYVEINRAIRKACPDIIINNTIVGGRKRFNTDPGILSPQYDYAIDANPEIGSLDTTAYTSRHILKKRQFPLTGRDEDTFSERTYGISDTEVEDLIKRFNDHGIKPEFECFSIGDFQYLTRLLKNGYKDLYGGPHLIQLVFTNFLTWPTPQYFALAFDTLPQNAMLSIIATGSQHWPLLSMALSTGLHVRTGMEDNIYLERGVLAKGNAQLVEKTVRIAGEIGRRIATPAQARKMLGLPPPRDYI